MEASLKEAVLKEIILSRESLKRNLRANNKCHCEGLHFPWHVSVFVVTHYFQCTLAKDQIVLKQ